MRPTFAISLVGAALAACSPLTAREPLFEAGAVRPALGLWAAVGQGCAMPTSPDVRGWKPCVQPIRVEADRVSFTRAPGAPQTALQFTGPFAVSDGDPTLVRFGGPADAAPSGPGYHFAAVTGLRRNASGEVIEARGEFLLCPSEAAIPGIVQSEDACEARTLPALRRAAVLQLAEDTTEPGHLRWIAPLP